MGHCRYKLLFGSVITLSVIQKYFNFMVSYKFQKQYMKRMFFGTRGIILYAVLTVNN